MILTKSAISSFSRRIVTNIFTLDTEIDDQDQGQLK